MISSFFEKKILLIKIIYNQNRLRERVDVWRNILHPHKKTANMSSKVMSNTITLFTNMRKASEIKRSHTKFSLKNKVTIRGIRLIFTTKCSDDYLGSAFKNNRRETELLSKVYSFHSSSDFYLCHRIGKRNLFGH